MLTIYVDADACPVKEEVYRKRSVAMVMEIAPFPTVLASRPVMLVRMSDVTRMFEAAADARTSGSDPRRRSRNAQKPWRRSTLLTGNPNDFPFFECSNGRPA